MKDDPSVAIVGAGAVGSYYGAKLARAGVDVRFLFRSSFAAVRDNGLTVRQKEGDDFHLDAKAYQDAAEIGTVDLVIIALKTTANDAMVEMVRPLVGEDTLILTLQNGIGNVETLTAAFGKEQVLGGLCFVCINRIEPHIIENYLAGSVVVAEAFGEPQERTRQVAELFTRAGVDCKVAPSLAEALWKKLCWNVPFNGLAIAAGGVPTDVIMQSPELKRLARLLMDEVVDAASRIGVTIPNYFLEKQFSVTEKMGAYRPSSMIDYCEGRAVEVESIWGEALRQGQKAGAPMLRLEALYLLIKHLCEKKS